MTQQLQTTTDPAHETVTPPRKKIPGWASLSLALNGVVLLGVSVGVAKPHLLARVLPGLTPTAAVVAPDAEAVMPEGGGDRKQLSYEQWREVLQQEATAAAKNQPENLTVLLGDSITLWFPPELLPNDRTWLNQAISGDTTAGLLKRSDLLSPTQPQTIFLMAGINDLKTGVPEAETLANTRQLIQQLRQQHPEAEIVLQAILPHGGEPMTTAEREPFLKISNEQIFKLNQQLAAIAQEEQVFFLNLYSLFANEEGFLRSELSTDGLHLNPEGYRVWRTALQVFGQTALKPVTAIAKAPSEAAPEASSTTEAGQTEAPAESPAPAEIPSDAQPAPAEPALPEGSSEPATP
jgi:lysophospholipase L1-like esterase